jgi:hypothetical protein
MADTQKPMAVLAKYFGRLPGQSLKDFSVEVKALTEIDKKQLVDGIVNGSLTY